MQCLSDDTQRFGKPAGAKVSSLSRAQVWQKERLTGSRKTVTQLWPMEPLTQSSRQ